MVNRIILAVVACCATVAFALPAYADLSVETKKVEAAGKSFSVNVIRAPLSLYKVKVALADGKVGATAPLDEIATSAGALAAINGCFFDAYTDDAIKAPYHNLITGGKVVHIGDTGTTLGFDADGGYLMQRVKIRVHGGLDGNYGYPDDWYAFLVNHPAKQSSIAAIYDSLWDGDWTPAAGTQVSVSFDFKVESVGAGPTEMPAGGFVIVFSGGEEYLAKKFIENRTVNVRWTFEDADAARGSASGSSSFWSRCTEAIGCGPRLVAGGAVAYAPESEGFSSPKILTNSGARSAVGVTAGGEILLVTCGAATVKELAGIMQQLGAYDAMNLDGGASSGLWTNGRYATTPGRDISNALVVVER